jgi:beta-glucanase (GH16 family)
MSDEFNVEGRSFKDGDDPTWTALDKSDDDASAAGGGSLVFYNSSMVSTNKDGYLELRSIVDKTEWEHFDVVKQEYKHITKNFKSSMVQSWNKFCFTGGIIEYDIVLPGDPYIGGLWPAVWLLGNLGRATYEGSTNNIWPWSYDKCDRKKQEAQTISACNSQNHFGLNPYQGRGATEIDLIEMMAGKPDIDLKGTDPNVAYPYADFTLQVSLVCL